MRLPRVSIATLTFVVALVAVDVALIRYYVMPGRALMVRLRFGILMANVLPLALYRLSTRRGPVRPFLRGFVAFGLAAALLCQFGCAVAPDAMHDLQQGASYRVAYFLNAKLHAFFPSLKAGSSTFRYLFNATVIPAIAVVIGLPQLLVALSGGLAVWWARRPIAT